MTPEQRAAHAEMLRMMALDVVHEVSTYPNHAERLPVLARELSNLNAVRAACLAGAAALRAAIAPPSTCGTCMRWDASGPYGGRRCLVYGGMRAADDGCIKGYVPTEPTR